MFSINKFQSTDKYIIYSNLREGEKTMKADLNVAFGKIGLDDDTAKIFNEYIQSQKNGSRKTVRVEVGEEAKSVFNGVITLGVLGILAYATVSICKIVYAK